MRGTSSDARNARKSASGARTSGMPGFEAEVESEVDGDRVAIEDDVVVVGGLGGSTSRRRRSAGGGLSRRLVTPPGRKIGTVNGRVPSQALQAFATGQKRKQKRSTLETVLEVRLELRLREREDKGSQRLELRSAQGEIVERQCRFHAGPSKLHRLQEP